MTEQDGQVLRIIELQAENVKRLKAVRIRPDSTLVRIEGRNAQGKSSVLDAISAALGGGRWQPEKPVREGEKKASVVLDLGSLKVERRWSARGGTVLEVTDTNGQRQSSPQAILDQLVGDLTFDPLEFVRMKPKEQADLLRRLAGLDFAELDTERDRLYGERTIQNRDAKAAAARVGSAPPKPSSTGAVDIRALAEKQQAALAHNRAVDEVCRAVDLAKQEVERTSQEVNRAEQEQKRIEEWKAQELRRVAERADREMRGVANGIDLAMKQKHIATLAENESRNKAAVYRPREDVADLGAEIAKAEEHNAAIIAHRQWEESSAWAKEAQATADGLNDRIEAIDAEKDRLLRAAKFPLEGLSLDVNGPTLNGIPFSQASSAEQLRTGVAIGLSQKRPARIMLIRDGSLLDGENLLQLHKIAEEFDAQVFVERVAESASPSAVFIQDGEVQEVAS